MQDCGKVVQKLAQREDENHKLCTTLCAPLRLGTRIVQVSFPLCVRCVGVVVRRCAIRSFSLPPAETGFPFRRRGRGGRQTGAGCCARGRPPLPSPSPTLRSALRPSAGGGAAVDKLSRGERTALRPSTGGGRGRRQVAAGRTHGASLISGRGHGRRQAAAGRTHGQGRGWPCALPPLRTVIRHTGCVVRHTSGMVRHTSSILRHCTRVRPPLSSALPHPAHGGAGRGATTARGRTIYYIYACAGARARTFCTGRRATMWITFPWITHCG